MHVGCWCRVGKSGQRRKWSDCVGGSREAAIRGGGCGRKRRSEGTRSRWRAAGVRGSARGPSRDQHGQLSFRRGLRTAFRLWACLPRRPRPPHPLPPRLGVLRCWGYTVRCGGHYSVGGPARERLTPTYWRRSSNRSCPQIDAAPSAPGSAISRNRRWRWGRPRIAPCPGRRRRCPCEGS